MQQVGNCPKCGAPIYAREQPVGTSAVQEIPKPEYTCTCRTQAPKEQLDPDGKKLLLD